MPSSTIVGQGPELPHEAEYRERIERARGEARSRYRDHLAAAFEQHSVAESSELADVALDALIVWRYSDSGERCAVTAVPWRLAPGLRRRLCRSVPCEGA